MTVLIVDDHPSFRSFARQLLSSQGYEVIGEAEDGQSALRAVSALTPDVVLLDVQLPDRDGVSIAEQLAEGSVSPDVVFVSTRPASDYGERLSNAPARGFIPKAELSGTALARLLDGGA